MFSFRFHSKKKGMLHFAVVLFFVFVLTQVRLFATGADNGKSGQKQIEEPPPLTVLFTNDGHSSGDYSRMATLIKQERRRAEEAGSAVVVVDAGDIAMGSIFQTIYADHAFDYVAKALMGYDAVTCGNHDFDFGISAFRSMLSVAGSSPYLADTSNNADLPYFVVSNLNTVNPPHFEELGIRDTLVLHKTVGTGSGKKRVSIGLYGLMGEHAYSCIANNDSLFFYSRLESADRAVLALMAKDVDYIISLSHGGTLWAKGKKVEAGSKGYTKLKALTEDGKIANNLSGTDVIISGHDHELLDKPLIYGNTVIGSAGLKNGYLGKIVMAGDSLVEYSIIPVTEDVSSDVHMQQYLADSYAKVLEKFSVLCGVALDDTIATIDKSLPLVIDKEGNMELGFYIADSYRTAAQSVVEAPVAIVPYGVVRKALEQGAVTNRMAFEALSLGMGADGTPGYPLIVAWVTGSELYDICELNASVAWGMEDARLFFSGMAFEYNRYRIPFTRVTQVSVDGRPVEKQKLYPIVTGLYTAQLMGMLKSSSFGLLSVVPKDPEGSPIEDISSSLLICTDSSSHLAAISEWKAFAEYIKKTELKNQPEKCSVDNSTPFVYIKYFVMLLVAVISAIWLLRSGKHVHGRQL